MPLTINVGLNRKASKDYQSTGAPINLTAELDQSLLARPDELQGAVSELYEQAELALDRKMDGGPSPAAVSSDRTRFNDNGRSSLTGGNGRDARRSQNGRGATQAQLKAINAIAGQLGIDAGAEVRHEFGTELPDLSIRDASKLIDLLKSRQTTPANRSRS